MVGKSGAPFPIIQEQDSISYSVNITIYYLPGILTSNPGRPLSALELCIKIVAMLGIMYPQHELYYGYHISKQ